MGVGNTVSSTYGDDVAYKIASVHTHTFPPQNDKYGYSEFPQFTLLPNAQGHV